MDEVDHEESSQTIWIVIMCYTRQTLTIGDRRELDWVKPCSRE